jgi:hypothetical protein
VSYQAKEIRISRTVSYQAKRLVSGHGFSRAIKADLENGLQPLMEFMDEQKWTSNTK